MMNKQKMLIPNEFQSEALIELEKAELNKNSGIIVMPTGTGKTYLAVLWFKKQLDINPNSKLLFICHNKDLISQANEKEFQEGLTNLDISYGYYTAKEKNIQQATFATVQTLTRNLDVFDKTQFDYIIVDEAHHYQAKTFKKAVQYFTPKFLLGLTATPNRLDGKKITDICGDIVFDSKISDAISKQLLVPIKYYCVDHNIDFSNIKWNGTNYDAKDLNKKLCIKEYDDAILKEYNETVIKQHNRHKTICFCATIEHCRRMEQLFMSHGISSIALTGADNSVKRKNTVYAFRNGKYDIIFVRDLFNEGVDIPDADCVMFLRPTQSYTIFTQQIGRGLRTAANKEYLLALDFTGNSRKCDINFDVLDEIVDFDILNRVKDKNNADTSIYYANNGCEINLTREKIDILNNSINIITKEDVIKEYKRLKKELKRIPKTTEFPQYQALRHMYGNYSNFLKKQNDYELYVIQKKKSKKNINIISMYIPIISIKTIRNPSKKGVKKIYNIKQTKYKTTDKKVSIRSKIIKYINDNDTILLLESPELSAIKEIELQGKNPKKIIIPNNKEFNELADALSKYDTKLNIEIINTSALQYIADTKELFDFVWLDYCGAFSSYHQDLDILLKKNNVNFKLILTYTTFDPLKDNDNNYMINVIDYILANTDNHKTIRLLKNISYRYKQNMYNIGVTLSKSCSVKVGGINV